MRTTTRVLVTGATGFVGSHLAEALRGRGFEVRALVRATSDTERLTRLGVDRVEGEIDDPVALARAVEGAQIVFHLAAVTKARSGQEYERINVRGTERLIEAIIAADPRPCRLVYLSSLAAAGPSPDDRPVDRHAVPDPLTVYGRTKLAAEVACLAVQDQIQVVVLRASAVYGPRDRELLRFFRLAAGGVVPIPAGPRRRIQLLHVADLAEALADAAVAPGASGVYHVAEAEAYTWEEVVALIGSAVGRTPRLVRIPPAIVRGAATLSELAASLVGRSTMFNREKAKELLAPAWLCETDALREDVGFRTRIPLPRGLVQTADWYRARGWL